MGTPSLPQDSPESPESSDSEEPGIPATPERPGFPPAHAWDSPAPSRANRRTIASLLLGLLVVGVSAVIAGAFLVSAHPNALSRSPGLRLVSELSSGACVDLPPSSRQRLPDWVTAASCSRPHDRQLYAKIMLRGPFPGDLQGQQETRLACAAALGEFLDPLGVEQASQPFSYPPAPADWRAGRPQAWCTLAGQSGQLTGDLSQVPGDYTADQLEFLRATHVTELLDLTVETSLEANLMQARGYAAELAKAYQAEARQLTALRFPLRGEQTAVAAIARDDLSEVSQARALASTSSQRRAAELGARISSFAFGQDMQTVRVQLGLNAA